MGWAMRVDWALLAALLVKAHGNCEAVARKAQTDGVKMTGSSMRYARGKSGSRRDVAAWMILEAQRLGITIPELEQIDRP